MSVPFAGAYFYQLKRAANKIGISLVSKPSQTLGAVLCSKSKHKLPKHQESNVVYQIECSCKIDGDPVIYIGETDRELGTRVREHRDCWSGSRSSRANASAFNSHRQCTPLFDDAKILDRAAHHQMRLLLESAYIRTSVSETPHRLTVQSPSRKMRSVAVLALLWTAAGAALFRSRLVEHAQTPLRSAGGVSGIQCASLCLWTSDCVGWSRDPHTGACRLWPPASAQNPLTPLKELVFQSRLIAVPDGFTVSDDPKVAYNIIMIVASLYKESGNIALLVVTVKQSIH
ncbi:hypothetical protein FJT64_023834 [Amphibalanus amphitrite]|uniref:GIY-YIG domain-containing protein n=1 Tax=Amphibalanus amphitrite TaxID=1232801 RepID=A0A6A4W992_AMPAM|nr:hypothetical protein FJT64_023834 [Amphibalanus amphitrite]